MPHGEIEQNCWRTIHAEINAITQAAKNGAAIRDADIYVTHTPCIHCLKVLINTGIRTVYYGREYKLHTVGESQACGGKARAGGAGGRGCTHLRVAREHAAAPRRGRVESARSSSDAARAPSRIS